MITMVILVAVFYLGLSFWLVQSVDSNPTNLGDDEKVTVIIPVKNGAEDLLTCVQSILKSQVYLSEIIVVDDGASAIIHEQIRLVTYSKVRIVSNVYSGKKQAVQLGVELAKTQWVAVVDVDVLVSNNWLKTLLSYVNPETHMVLGPVFISPKGPMLQQVQALEFMGLQTATRGTANRKIPISANGANMLFRKSTFEQLQPYNGNYSRPTGDDVFLMNAIFNQYPSGIVYASSKWALALTKPVTSIAQLLKQRVRWASKADVVEGVNQKMVGVVVVLANVLMIYSFGQILMHGFNQFTAFVLLKAMADWAMMKHASKMTSLKVPHLSFMVSTLVYPFIVIWSLLAGLNFKKQTAPH